jgi:type VI secretion system secreted protein VgrG
MALTQDNLDITLTTPLGKDKLIIKRFSGEEKVSGLFRFYLEMISDANDLSFEKIVGKNITVTMKLAESGERYFHGLVGKFVQAGGDEKNTTYLADVYPWLWMLTLTRDSKIFQNKSVPDIIEEIFKDSGFTDFKNSLTRTYQPREYCVQYQESAFDFVSRLMEDEGMFYFFEHEKSKHTLVMADDASTHKPCPNIASVRFGRSMSSAQEDDVLVQCTFEQNVATGKYDMDDYDFETPATDLMVKAAGKASKMRVYEYPGGFVKKDAGEKRANVRLEGREYPIKMLTGAGFCRDFRPGFKFDLKEHSRTDMNSSYVLSQVVHSGTQEEYSNSFRGFPSDVPFRPAMATPKPFIPGTQTALVVGKSGEEIWTDKYGRIKVQFHWDQEGKKDENSSCWIRVSTSWAGKSWGNIFIPRIGQEVVVSFVNGDPDRPLVTGSVYNATQTVPYALPANSTKSALKSDSSKGSGGFNEIRFEDKKDSEEIYVHAQKDMNITVENDRVKEVLNDEKSTITKNRKTTILEGSDTLEISEGNRTYSVNGKEVYSVKGKDGGFWDNLFEEMGLVDKEDARTLNIDGNETHNNTGDFVHKVDGDYTLDVTGDITIKADGNITIEGSEAVTITSGKDMTGKADGAMNLESGKAYTAKAGTALTNQAGTELTNKAGTNLTNQAGANLTNKGGANSENTAGAIMTIKGSMTKIG